MNSVVVLCVVFHSWIVLVYIYLSAYGQFFWYCLWVDCSSLCLCDYCCCLCIGSSFEAWISGTQDTGVVFASDWWLVGVNVVVTVVSRPWRCTSSRRHATAQSQTGSGCWCCIVSIEQWYWVHRCLWFWGYMQQVFMNECCLSTYCLCSLGQSQWPPEHVVWELLEQVVF